MDLAVLLKTRVWQDIRNPVKVYVFYNQINVQRQTIDLRQHLNAIVDRPNQACLYTRITSHDLFRKQRSWRWRIAWHGRSTLIMTLVHTATGQGDEKGSQCDEFLHDS